MNVDFSFLNERTETFIAGEGILWFSKTLCERG